MMILVAKRGTASYDVGFVGKVNFLLFHGTEDDLESMEKVVEDGDLPLLAL